jgi:phosphatidylglycerol:prolipoprotein diacylglycerol transferase
VWEGGLTFYGGLAAGVGFGIGYLRAKGLRVLEVTDIIAPQIALGIGLARIGCFLNGCCFGTESDLPWACTFPADSQAGWVMGGRSLHPAQIYSAIANFVIFLFLRRLRAAEPVRGTVFYAFLIVYGVWRYVIDYMRYYEEHMYLDLMGTTMTWNQLLSLIIAAAGALLLILSRLRSRRHHEC